MTRQHITFTACGIGHASTAIQTEDPRSCIRMDAFLFPGGTVRFLMQDESSAVFRTYLCPDRCSAEDLFTEFGVYMAACRERPPYAEDIRDLFPEAARYEDIETMPLRCPGPERPGVIYKYLVTRTTLDFPLEKKDLIRRGCTVNDEVPETLQVFDRAEDAAAAIQAYHTSIAIHDKEGDGRRIRVTEYHVDKVAFEGNGDYWTEGICCFAEGDLKRLLDRFPKEALHMAEAADAEAGPGGTVPDWKGKYKAEDGVLTIFWKRSDLEKVKKCLQKMAAECTEPVEDGLYAPPLPGFEDTPLSPWIYPHLVHDKDGTYLRCALYAEWNGCEYDAISCLDGPEQLLDWEPEFPEGWPFGKLAFELADDGMAFS